MTLIKRKQVSDNSASSETVINEIKAELENVTAQNSVLQWYVSHSPYYGMFENCPNQVLTFLTSTCKINVVMSLRVITTPYQSNLNLVFI